MATSPDSTYDDEMLPHYDFSTMKGVVRGKYAARLRAQEHLVKLEDDVALLFPSSEAVNAALREYAVWRQVRQAV